MCERASRRERGIDRRLGMFVDDGGGRPTDTSNKFHFDTIVFHRLAIFPTYYDLFQCRQRRIIAGGQVGVGASIVRRCIKRRQLPSHRKHEYVYHEPTRLSFHSLTVVVDGTCLSPVLLPLHFYHFTLIFTIQQDISIYPCLKDREPRCHSTVALVKKVCRHEDNLFVRTKALSGKGRVSFRADASLARR